VRRQSKSTVRFFSLSLVQLLSSGLRRGPLWASLAAFLAVSGCATAPSNQSAAVAPVSAATSAATPDLAKFAAFLARFRSKALAAGISPAVFDRSLGAVTPNPQIYALENRQPEFVRPIWSYLDTAVSPLRIAEGRSELASHGAMLEQLEGRFGVPKQILVAIWGMETDYGADLGQYDMFQALSTLAFDGRRARFGERELLAALRMEQEEGYTPSMMVSSWAGAFGQTQFMPTTFLAHAVSAEPDGHIDLWHSPADALASTANLLVAYGWTADAPVLREVQLPSGFPYGEAELSNPQPTAYWQGLGVRTATGGDLPEAPNAAIFLPAGAEGPAFLTYPNFKVLLAYNHATAYALGVSLLAQQIMGGPPVLRSWPRDEAPLDHADAVTLQSDLKLLGYHPGPVDGLIGPDVRAALRAYQRQEGLIADGFATHQLLLRIEADAHARSG
jgi:membrane-bound lytic murein transglycosylase B